MINRAKEIGAREITPADMTREGFKAFVNDWRDAVKIIADGVRNLKGHPTAKTPEPGVDCGEVNANIMLAYRHLEDARMRLGKAIQATEGGVSCYDKK
jgi:hypothetical protein